MPERRHDTLVPRYGSFVTVEPDFGGLIELLVGEASPQQGYVTVEALPLA